MENIIKGGLGLIAEEGVKELIKTCFSSYIKPKLDKMYKDNQIDKKNDFFQEYIEEYLERTFNNNLIMNTIVFKNRQKTIYDLYIPLTIINKRVENSTVESICINKYPDDAMEKYKRLLLVDNAGMGKSTILKYIYLTIIKENKGIPVLIEVRKLNKDIPIIDYITNEINGIRKYFTNEDVMRLISEGDFIFLLDGYDEIAQESKEQVTQNIQDFILKCENNKFIMTSREENELNCFGNFQRFYIRPLRKKEAYELIEKYDNGGEISKKIIEKLKTEENLKIINEFLENPLMVSLLYKAFEYKESIPYKKYIFYRQVYDALFEEHDLSKPGAYKRTKRSGLDIEDFHMILRCIGFMTLIKGIVYSVNELIEVIKKAKKKNINCSFKESDFIYDITHSVPLFIKEGNMYRWSHKSFQEYFAACYIAFDAKDQQEKLLTSLSSKNKINKYYNVLDFYYDIDYKQFSRVIIYSFLDEMKKYMDDTYTSEYFKDIDKNQLQLRKILDFSYDKIIIRRIPNNEVKKMITTEPSEIFKQFFGESRGSACCITNNIIGILWESKYIAKLLKLLNNKKSKIVENIDLSSESNIESRIVEILDSGKYIIDDEVENVLNDKKNFSLINKYILKSVNERPNREKAIVFNYSKCMELKKSIEEDIRNEKDDIYFL